MVRYVLVLLLSAGCIQSELVPCSDQVCPVGQVCTPGGCATTEGVDACLDKADGDACTTEEIPRGACSLGACHKVVCGDRVQALDEVCDDGNTTDGDGCSADCSSLELCGNQIIDPVTGEQCDSGLAGLSGDGCSSTCLAETGAWRDATPQNISPRSGYSMAYDKQHAVVVLFGGADALGPLGDTWVWDGVTWTQLDPLVSPPPRRGGAMAFDETHHEMILYGGSGTQSVLGDTWRWDGTNWTLLSPPVTPGPRADAAMAYYPEASGLLLHGGTFQQDSWEWNGTTWIAGDSVLHPMSNPIDHPAMTTYDGTVMLYGASSGDQGGATWLPVQEASFEMADPGGPPGIDDAALAYDGTKAILFGGFTGTVSLANTTFEWPNGATTWIDKTSTIRPPGRRQAKLVFDVARNMSVLFGGTTDAGLANDTWTYAGSTSAWNQPALPPRSPSARFTPCTYDAVRGRIVLFGGFSPLGGLSDTWAWHANRWTRVTGSGPSARSEHAIAYDVARKVVVLFGGLAGNSLADTWELGDQGWVLRTPPTSPSTRRQAEMTFDVARHEIVMVGGLQATNNLPSDMWTYDGVDWMSHGNATPAITYGHKLAYDAARERVVLFGGMRNGVHLDETWEWDGANWTQLTPTIKPPPRAYHTLVYDPSRRRVVLIGGESATGVPLADTWEWDGTSWTQTALVNSAPARAYSCGAYDGIGRQLVIFGGRDFSGSFVAATSALMFSNDVQRVERCRLATDDLDSDGLMTCADPDCWGRCEPGCPPGSSCSPTEPHCGDGTCGSVEDHDLCPADCP